MPRAVSKKKMRHDPLHVELRADGQAQTKGRTKYTERDNERMAKESGEGYVDPKTSRRLLDIAREQQEEVEAEDNDEYTEFPEDEAAEHSDESDEGE
ncbi:hypothetical protein IW145_006684, partial [Coemansia sp. RSA 521]